MQHSVSELLQFVGDAARIEQRIDQMPCASKAESSACLRARRELSRVSIDARKERSLPFGIEVELGIGARERRERRHRRRFREQRARTRHKRGWRLP